MTTAEVLAQKKSDSVLGRGLSEMTQQNIQSPTNITQAEQPKTLSELKVEIKFHLGQMAGHAIEIGRLLIQAKEQVNHGEWQSWLEDNFNLTSRSARNFMKVAERFGKTEINFRFQTTQMIAMLALPEGEEEKFIAEKAAENNPVEDMTIKNLREEIKNYKAKLADITQERDGYKRANEIADGQLETTGEENEKLRKSLIDANKTIDGFTEENINLREEKIELQEKIDDLQNQILQNGVTTVEVEPEDYQPMKQELSATKAEVEKLQAELKTLQEKPVDVAVEYPADYESTKAELAALKEKQSNLQAEYSVSKKISEMFSAIPVLLNYTNLIEVVAKLAEKDSRIGEKIIQLGSLQVELKNYFEIWEQGNGK